MTGRLARRYARALLDLARQESALEKFGEELGRALAAFEDPRLRPLCLSPVLDRGSRVRNTKEVLGALGLSRMVSNLIALLADRDRLGLLADVARWYDALVDEALGRIRVAIRTAAPLGAAQKAELIAVAQKLTGRTEVLATTDVDAELIGGVVLDVNGTVYDGSVKSQLVQLCKQMAEGGA